jgi:hypothetical protein
MWRNVELTIVVESEIKPLALPAEARLPVRAEISGRVRERQPLGLADDD